MLAFFTQPLEEASFGLPKNSPPRVTCRVTRGGMLLLFFALFFLTIDKSCEKEFRFAIRSKDW